MSRLVVSAHLDDAVLSCWRALSLHGDTTVVTVFAGSPDQGELGTWDALTGADNSKLRVEERQHEDRSALALTGSIPIHLEFLDGQYRSTRRDAAPIESELRKVIESKRPEEVWIPAAIGGHPDHECSRDVALSTVDEAELVLYADLPYTAMFGSPLTTAAADFLDAQRWIDAQLAATGFDIGWQNARVDRLKPKEWHAKSAAVGCYRTQLAALEAWFGRAFVKDVLATEVTWKVKPQRPSPNLESS